MIWSGKGIILFLLGYVLYMQLFVKQDIAELSAEFNNSLKIKNGWIFISAAIFLMPINWFLESVKWRVLIRNFQEFSIGQSVKSILSGVSMAIMTPGRLGEYGGRLVGIQSENRTKAILANFVASLSQNIINIGLGLLLALFFLNRYIELEQGVFLSLFFGSVIVICLLLLAYFRIDLIGGLLAYLPDYNWVDKLRSSVTSVSKIENKMLFRLLGISLVRYLVYLSQYVMFIFFFGVTDQFWSAVFGVGTIFFLQSNLPLPPVLSVLARGEMAIFLWSVFTDNVLGIVAATFSLWFINLVLPALVGLIIILGTEVKE